MTTTHTKKNSCTQTVHTSFSKSHDVSSFFVNFLYIFLNWVKCPQRPRLQWDVNVQSSTVPLHTQILSRFPKKHNIPNISRSPNRISRSFPTTQNTSYNALKNMCVFPQNICSYSFQERCCITERLYKSQIMFLMDRLVVCRVNTVTVPHQAGRWSPSYTELLWTRSTLTPALNEGRLTRRKTEIKTRYWRCMYLLYHFYIVIRDTKEQTVWHDNKR